MYTPTNDAWFLQILSKVCFKLLNFCQLYSENTVVVFNSTSLIINETPSIHSSSLLVSYLQLLSILDFVCLFVFSYQSSLQILEISTLCYVLKTVYS